MMATAAASTACGGTRGPIDYQRLPGGELADLTLIDAGRDEHQLWDQLRGPVVLHVFASWCAACRWELPALMRLETETRIPVLALSIDPTFSRVRALFEGAPPDNVFRVDEQDVRRELGVASLPQTFLVDARRRVRMRFVGARDWSDDDLRDLVRRELRIAE